LLNVWQEALDKGDKMKVDYYLLFTIERFLKYAAELIGQAVGCCISHLPLATNGLTFRMGK